MARDLCPDGCTRIMQINRNPSATKRVSINFEMSPVKIQAHHEDRRSSARTGELILTNNCRNCAREVKRKSPL